MNILLEELPHQEQALAAILASFTGIDHAQADHNHYANPLIKERYDDKANIDVKMETGTGKTYVYTRLMYELHQNYGLFKFVLVVPTPAIKEGARNFITSDYARQHFSQFYENTRMELCTINAGDFKVKSGRKNFPAQLLSFTDASRRDSHTIQVLLINAQMLNSASMTRDDYDQTLLGGLTSPVKGLQMTRPVVIIDEPHRFARDNKFYRAIQAIQPQMIVRFGATFPDIVEGKGKNKCVRKDYYRRQPQFDLNAVDSFNDGLVKGIDIYYPNLPEEQANNRYIVDSVTAKKLILRRGGKIAEVGVGENLADVDAGFEGSIEYAGSKMLSNDLELEAGMALVPGTFGASYQELIIQDAIDKHFDTEQANFLRSNEPENNAPRIKTLSLFFIDSIKSYRDDEGWLKLKFECLLKKKLMQLIDDYQRKTLPREVEYLSFLQATLTHDDIAERWFTLPNLYYFLPVPVLVLAFSVWLWRSVKKPESHARPFILTLGLIFLGFSGLGISIWPNIIPPDISLYAAAAPPQSQSFMLVGALIIIPIILAYTFWSYYVFRGKVRHGEGYH